ncbi:MAG: hypothetical protein ACKVY0_01220 [Prosthecobacter sp.]|uniref:hypothetical protein n=1 Tax=Prosthecobacter sp. TaxID=1965333 RepID=UPI003902758D
MQGSLSFRDTLSYVAAQLNRLFPDGNVVAEDDLEHPVKEALEAAEFCFAHIKDRHFWRGDRPCFDHLHSEQYSMFLYWAGHAAWRQNKPAHVPLKLYLLNKALHGIDLFHEVVMPRVFKLGHGVGSVLGRATYGEYFFVSQCCTVGAVGYDYPVFGRGVVLSSASSVLGRSHLHDEVCVGAGTLLVNETVEAGMTVVGHTPDIRCWPSKSPSWKNLFFEAVTGV